MLLTQAITAVKAVTTSSPLNSSSIVSMFRYGACPIFKDSLVKH
jgi:hypothetical protein